MARGPKGPLEGGLEKGLVGTGFLYGGPCLKKPNLFRSGEGGGGGLIIRGTSQLKLQIKRTELVKSIGSGPGARNRKNIERKVENGEVEGGGKTGNWEKDCVVVYSDRTIGRVIFGGRKSGS